MIGTIALVPQIADATRIPVVASGGVMDGRGIATALAFRSHGGADGHGLSTCEEAGVSDVYKDAIVRARDDETRLTRAFSGRPARGIVNRFMREVDPHPDAILPFPLQNALTRLPRRLPRPAERSSCPSGQDRACAWRGVRARATS